MKRDQLRHLWQRYSAYGIFLAPLAPCFGGGWRGVFIATTVKGLLFGIPYAMMLHYFHREIEFSWMLPVAVIVPCHFIVEANAHRKGQR